MASSAAAQRLKKRPDYKEESRSAQGIGRVRNESEARRNIGAPNGRKAHRRIGVALEVPVVQQRDSPRAEDQYRPLFVKEDLARADVRAALVDQPVALMVHDERRVGERYEDALRTVLEEPAAPPVCLVVPADVPGTPPNWSVRKRRLRGGKQDGVDLVEINNGRMTIFVLPTR